MKKYFFLRFAHKPAFAGGRVNCNRITYGWIPVWKLLYSQSVKLKKRKRQEGLAVKGYFVGEGYMGYVDGEYLLFADESDYRDYMEEE